MGKYRHIKTKRQARKKVKTAATLNHNKTVNNTYKNCIPTVESPIAAAWDNGKWFKEMREKRMKELGERYSKNGNGHRLNRKQPWYMLTKGKHWFKTSTTEEDGMKKKFIEPVDSEIKTLSKKYVIPKMGIAEKLHKIEQMKITKWEKKHPRPIKEGESDLFEKHFLPEWEAEREKEIERIRDFVVSAYDKNNAGGKVKQPTKKKPSAMLKSLSVTSDAEQPLKAAA